MVMNVDNIMNIASETLNEEDRKTFDNFIYACRNYRYGGSSVATNLMHADEFIESLRTEFKRRESIESLKAEFKGQCQWTKAAMLEGFANIMAFDNFADNNEFFQILSDYINTVESGSYSYHSEPMLSFEDLDDLSLDDMFKDLMLYARN